MEIYMGFNRVLIGRSCDPTRFLGDLYGFEWDLIGF
jgi:hypothetical protein